MLKKDIDWEERLWEATLQIYCNSSNCDSTIDAIERAQKLLSMYKRMYREQLTKVDVDCKVQDCVLAVFGNGNFKE